MSRRVLTDGTLHHLWMTHEGENTLFCGLQKPVHGLERLIWPLECCVDVSHREECYRLIATNDS